MAGTLRVVRTRAFMRYNKDKGIWVDTDGLPQCDECGRSVAAVMRFGPGGGEWQHDVCSTCLYEAAAEARP